MNTKTFSRLLACGVFAGAAMSATAVTVLTTFESPEVPGTPPQNGASTFGLSPTAFSSAMAAAGLPGWSSNAQVTLSEVGSNSVGNAGNQFLFLSPGDIATYTFSGLSVGTSYDLYFSFDYSGAASATTTTAGAVAVLNGGSFIIPTANLAKDTPSGSTTNTYFANLGPAPITNLSFIAQSFALAFIFSVGGPGSGNLALAIDNVRIDLNPSAVPEPGTSAMLAAGLSAMAFVVRRRRRV